VPRGGYWLRRILDGDLTETPAVPAKAETPAAPAPAPVKTKKEKEATDADHV
jgi:hypothetical protein